METHSNILALRIHGQRSLAGYSVTLLHRVTQSQMTEVT